MSRSIWKNRRTLQQLHEMHQDTIGAHLGIEFLEVGDDFLVARMPIDSRTRQPMGILHGGASVTLAETLGSVGASMCVEPGVPVVGLDINANHVRALQSGWVTGRAQPVHVGRTTQVWQIELRDDRQRLSCTSRLTIAVLPKGGAGLDLVAKSR